jgi:endonuclease-3
MSVPNRSTLIGQTYNVLKKHYNPVKPPADRPLLEHLLYACCLENAHYEAADEAFAKLQQAFFDWNEIRVTTVTELAETMTSLPDPSAAASRLKRCLQNIFETHYAFDIEYLRKLNLGKAVKELEKVDGVTPFAVAYVAQNGLGGHAVPTSQGVIDALEVAGVVTPAEAKKKRTPGLERAIPKVKGVEFASLLHQLGADFFASPFASRTRSILTEISPDAKNRLPKRTPKTAPSDQQDKTPERRRDRARRKKGAGAKSPEAAAAGDASTQKKVDEKAIDRAAKKKKTPTPRKKKTKANTAAKKSPTKQLSQKKPR